MEKRVELKSFEDDALRSRAKGSISESKGQEFDRDRYELARVGKQQVLKVCLFSLSYSIMLRISASVRLGEHDWAFLWSNVYMGKFACVSDLRECSYID